ncbi:SRPBCC family protein [Gordonia sp. CPCC 205333]|uniref:SRPBCC family protein n=1 Tax=Gordonia sp. CPCC 205333 TaxID=3140790 RepID=UPI003AF3E99B
MTDRLIITAQRNLVVTPRELWAVTSDTSRYAEWVTTVREVLIHHGTATSELTYRERIAGAGPFEATVEWQVQQLIPNKLRIDSTERIGPLSDVLNIFRFEPIEGGIACSMVYEFHFRVRPKFLGKPVLKVMSASIQRDFDQSMRNLEDLTLSERDLNISR